MFINLVLEGLPYSPARKGQNLRGPKISIFFFLILYLELLTNVLKLGENVLC